MWWARWSWIGQKGTGFIIFCLTNYLVENMTPVTLQGWTGPYFFPPLRCYFVGVCLQSSHFPVADRGKKMMEIFLVSAKSRYSNDSHEFYLTHDVMIPHQQFHFNFVLCHTHTIVFSCGFYVRTTIILEYQILLWNTFTQVLQLLFILAHTAMLSPSLCCFITLRYLDSVSDNQHIHCRCWTFREAVIV